VFENSALGGRAARRGGFAPADFQAAQAFMRRFGSKPFLYIIDEPALVQA
jgi:hypothetical protein